MSALLPHLIAVLTCVGLFVVFGLLRRSRPSTTASCSTCTSTACRLKETCHGHD